MDWSWTDFHVGVRAVGVGHGMSGEDCMHFESATPLQWGKLHPLGKKGAFFPSLRTNPGL